MEVIWLLIGGGATWFVLNYRKTKARAKEAAGLEFAYFIHAMDAWNANRADLESLTAVLHHFAVYDTRRNDYATDPTGRSLPADRALLSTHWIEILKDSQLIGADGRPSLWNEGAASFWASVQLLREERDKLILQSHFGT